MTNFPLSVHTTYEELLRAHTVRSVVELPGKPFLRDMGERGRYWYIRRRVGNRSIQKYVGPDTADVRDRITQAQAASEETRAFDARCARLVAQLRVAGVPALDRETGKVLNAMAKSGVFRLGGTLIGTHAFRLYSAELGVSFADALAVTSDVDVAAFENLKLVVHDQVDPSLPKLFKDLNLHPAPGLDAKHRPTRWVMEGGGTEVEFLVPRMLGSSAVLKLAPLGVYAQPLPFLNFLIAEPISAVAIYRSGVLVQIPRPERYAVHKLIVASRRRRRSALKAKKDLAQAEILFEILNEDRPAELREAFATAWDVGPKWRDAIGQSLNRATRLKEITDSFDV